MQEKQDIILDRAKENICPLCKGEREITSKIVIYKGQKVFICKKHSVRNSK